jgi:hypothetical protein
MSSRKEGGKLKNETANALKGHGFSHAAEIQIIPRRLKPLPFPFCALGTAEAVPFQNTVSSIAEMRLPWRVGTGEINN